MTASSSRSIPSLDGLRACSVGIVIVSHFLAYLPGKENRVPFIQLSWLGKSGVDVFFVISGFLITGLLVKELDATGKISLRNFYFRRFFRIFPAFYTFLAVVGVLWALGVVAMKPAGFISSATYTSNYWGSPIWILAHTWSLGSEEQFYLLWPPCVLLLGKKRSTYLAIAIIALSPVSRFLTYVLAPSLRGSEGTMLHTRLDMIMFGCAIALLWEHKRFHDWAGRFLHPAVFAFSCLYIVVLAPCLSARFLGWYDWPVGYTLRGLLIALVMVYVVKKPTSSAGRFLNLGAMRHLGVISYSTYLWQQVFMGTFGGPLPLNLIPTYLAAELSYRVVERPAFRLRDLIGERLMKIPVKPSRNIEASSSPKSSRSNKDAILTTEG